MDKKMDKKTRRREDKREKMESGTYHNKDIHWPFL